ncbi:hypothetical protein D3C87_85750 [compost metagenome]
MNQENNYIIDDLKVTPAQLPSDSYFEGLKKNILAEITVDGLKKKEEEAPLLKTKASPGKGEKLRDTPRIIPLYKRWYVWGSAAAILAFALLFPWNTHTGSTTDSGSVNLSSVSNEEIYEYLSQNIEDLDPETIAVHLNSDGIMWDNSSEQEIPVIREAVSTKSILLENVKDEEILDYLKNESGELDEYLLIES